MADTTSTVSNFSVQRDDIIKRALRLVGAIGQGETPGTAAVTEATSALNALVQEYYTDGMPLWKITQLSITYTATETYNIGVGQTINNVAPLKILQAFNRTTNVSPNLDAPMIIVPFQDYLYIGAKQAPGTPNQLYYQVPGISDTTQTSNLKGIIKVYPLPDANTIANKTLQIVAQFPFTTFSAATDIPDFPTYWNNALIWGLAADLCVEYGVGPVDAGVIKNRAKAAKDAALSFGTEEGSLFLRPTAHYQSYGGSNKE